MVSWGVLTKKTNNMNRPLEFDKLPFYTQIYIQELEQEVNSLKEAFKIIKEGKEGNYTVKQK